MNEEVMKLFIEQGVWAVLFIFLLVYILKKQAIRDSAQEERERKYQELLTELSKKFDIVSSIRDDVSIIKQKLEKK